MFTRPTEYLESRFDKTHEHLQQFVLNPAGAGCGYHFAPSIILSAVLGWNLVYI